MLKHIFLLSDLANIEKKQGLLTDELHLKETTLRCGNPQKLLFMLYLQETALIHRIYY
jgi:hypothetical protein